MYCTLTILPIRFSVLHLPSRPVPGKNKFVKLYDWPLLLGEEL